MINKYCQKQKEKLRKKQARDIKVFEKKKRKNAKKGSRHILKSFWRTKRNKKKHQFHRERNNNLSEEEKGKTVEYEMFLFST